jgi:phosphoglycerate dehydrogenase-like enzyme
VIYFSLKQGWHYALGAKRLGRYPERVPAAGTFKSRVGIVSLGTIARLVIERLKPSAFELLAFDPYADPVRASKLGVKLVSLEEVFSRCDVVSLHTPLLPETRGLIGREHFSSMKAGATFINTSRGEIVREADLIETFSRRKDLTAVLDVTSPEPPAEGSPLYTLPNVVLTPHIAGSTGRECRRMGEAMIEEFDRWSAGSPLQCQVTQAQAALMA